MVFGGAGFLESQGRQMQDCGRSRGRLLRHYATDLNFELEESGFLNIAVCATPGNAHPTWMLRRCGEFHTALLAAALRPVRLFTGNDTWAVTTR
jgi:hypothetical protein